MKTIYLRHVREIVIAIEWGTPIKSHHLQAAENALYWEQEKRGGGKMNQESVDVLQELVDQFKGSDVVCPELLQDAKDILSAAFERNAKKAESAKKNFAT